MRCYVKSSTSSRVHSQEADDKVDSLAEGISQFHDQFEALFKRCMELGRETPLLLPHDFLDELETIADRDNQPEMLKGAAYKELKTAQEIVVTEHSLAIALRPAAGSWRYVKVDPETVNIKVVDTSSYLAIKEKLSPEKLEGDARFVLEVDLGAFRRDMPRMKRLSTIGRGVDFLNRHLSSSLSRDPASGGINGSLFTFLRTLTYAGSPLMLNGKLKSHHELWYALLDAEKLFSTKDPQSPYSEVSDSLQLLGFEPGWGHNIERAWDTMNLALDLLEAPDSARLQEFLSRTPNMFNVVILSPHGYFGQRDVLGKPDTGGQIVYILDQVRALEKEMRKRIKQQGLHDIVPQILVVTRLIPESQGTSCNQPLELIEGTTNAHILRVPFRQKNGDVLQQWISRFEVWPYLERFAAEATKAVKKELRDAGHLNP